ncbi:hypothetical protein [Helicobacter suis]|uniref:hypothetical protein n=1 Tax=Helicobacter suis TaxID=104628 RepID=UPI001E5AC2B6|nr:hypothetical protein [Helicobacter suis]
MNFYKIGDQLANKLTSHERFARACRGFKFYDPICFYKFCAINYLGGVDKLLFHSTLRVHLLFDLVA